MAPVQIQPVQSTWSRVLPIADTAATLFYARLFELDPNLRPLFKPDLALQKKNLRQTLGFSVSSLDHRVCDLGGYDEAGGKRRVMFLDLRKDTV